MLDIFDIFEYNPPMPLKLIPDTDPVLHEKAEPVQNVNEEVEPVLMEMIAIMVRAGGVGLAAPQVGIKKRFFIIAYGGLTNVYINPEIVKSEPKTVNMVEGCLSYPGQNREIVRHERIRVAYTTITGEHKSHYVNGMMARIFQHELDHLDGIVFLER